MPNYKVVTDLYAEMFKQVTANGKGKSKNNTILMGSYVKLTGNQNGIWEEVEAFGTKGWINGNKLGNSPDFKCFFVDVGQGDGVLIEIGNDTNGIKILIDGGPSDNLARYLSKWQYKYYFGKNQKVHIDYVFVSHFDKDHYNGLIDIINDDRYTFDKIYHAGIAKFDPKKPSYPASYNTDLGQKINENNEEYLITQFDTLSDLNALQAKGGMQASFERFLNAVNKANNEGRLNDFRRIDNISGTIVNQQINQKNFKIDVLGPVLSQTAAGKAFKYFDDESHTINGHSLVLKMTFGSKAFLFGGDLNIPAEEHLIEHYNQLNINPFEVDIAKSCHHGASEFTVEFMQHVNPFATVISSGDNESYSHPRADAIGCAGRYSRGTRPLVFSTELARSTNVKTDEILFGMINLRSNGNAILMAQMKEAKTSSNLWDMYVV